MKQNFKTLKLACYSANTTMAVVANLPPLLFLNFRSNYGISYSLLGTLVLINFFTQLIVDLIFSFFSHRFNIEKTVKFTPVLSVVGLLVFATAPIIFKNNVYLGLVIGTLLFSASAGLCEVLISPTIAAIPSDNPDREMSKLHAVYAWGSVAVVVVSTLLLFAFGQNNWQLLTVFLAIIPLVSTILFLKSDMPKIPAPEKASASLQFFKNKGVWICFIAMFCSGAAECTMSQWCSSFVEKGVGMSKIWGDILGVALFSVALGTGRTLYAKIGKNIEKVLLLGAIGASVCYIIATLSPFTFLSLFACAFTGFCVSMLWPGNLIIASEKYPKGGVLIFALMAAGGDFGAAAGPQLMGLITDTVSKNKAVIEYAVTGTLFTPEQIGMKVGMLVCSLFPLLAIPLFVGFIKKRR